MKHQVGAFLFSGYQVFYVDIYKWLNGTNKKFTSRSEDILKKDGPADLLLKVKKAVGLSQPVLFAGYDYGATLALKMASAYAAHVDKVIAFHPGWTPSKEMRVELAKIKCHVMIQWVDSDMFHPWSKWKGSVASIPKHTVEKVKIHPWNADCAKSSYKRFST